MTFRSLLEQYRHGDTEAAVAELARWDTKRLLKQGKDTVVGLGEPVLTLAAAALLHLEAVLQRGATVSPRAVGSDPSLEIACPLVRSVARRSGRDPALRDFCRDWYVSALSVCLQRRGIWVYGYYPVLVSAHEEFPNDPAILLVAGSGSGWSIQGATRKVFHLSAEGLLRRVLTLDPKCVEARIRLGRLLHVNGRPDEGRLELERARAEASEPPLAYLAALFLGRIHQEAGRFEDAKASYESAIETLPSAQAAYLSLGELLVAAGRLGEGWAGTRRMFGEDGHVRNPEREPIWTFDGGQFWRLDSLIAGMRAVVRR